MRPVVDGLPPIRAARVEAETVSALWTGIAEVRELVGEAATKAAVLGELGRHPLRLLHIASHGIASDRNPAASVLGLGPGHVGRLSAGEIAGDRSRPILWC